MFPIYILAGGLATRLGKISKKTPKCLIKINNKPFIYFQLKNLIENDVHDITLCLGYLSEQVIEYIDNSEFKDIGIKYSFDGEKRLGTGGAIKKAIYNTSSPFFVMYGDSFLNIDYHDAQKGFDAKKGPLMTIFKNNNLYDTSNVFFDGSVINYSKSNFQLEAKYIDYGLSIFTKDHFKKFDGEFDLSKLQEYFSQKKNLQWYEAKNRFYEIGSMEGLEELKKIL